MRLRLAFAFSILLLSISFCFVDAQSAFADFRINSGDLTSDNRGGVDPGKQSNNIVVNVLNGVYQIAAMVSVMIIVLSGIRYIIADGDPAKINAARKGIIYSLVGLVIIGSAFIITGIIQNLV